MLTALRVLAGGLAVFSIGLSTPAGAQAPDTARLVTTVADQTGGVLPGAVITLTRADDETRSPMPQTSTASTQGQTTIGSLRPGRYTLQVDFPGFQSAMRDVRLRAPMRTSSRRCQTRLAGSIS